MWQEFKTFIARGNVIDLAVAVVIGAAFGKIVTALVEGIIMPPIGLILAKVDFSSLFCPRYIERHSGVTRRSEDESDSGHRIWLALKRCDRFSDYRARDFYDGQSYQSN